MTTKKFSRYIEKFTCEKCGKKVRGNGYTNHCPNCLWSKHVDVNPGDRAEKCQGMMKPMRTEYIRREFIIVHRCQKCGAQRRIKAASDDNKKLLISLVNEDMHSPSTSS